MGVVYKPIYLYNNKMSEAETTKETEKTTEKTVEKTEKESDSNE